MAQKETSVWQVLDVVKLVLGLPFGAFSATTRESVRVSQSGYCDDCGGYAESLQIHHRVPQHMHGSDHPDNAVGLCDSCHKKWDALAEEGIVYPNIAMCEAPVSCFNNRQVRDRVIVLFR